MSTLQWYVATAALGVTALFLWSETRVTAQAPIVRAPAASPPSPQTSPELASLASRHGNSLPVAPEPATDNSSQVRARFATERIDASWASATHAQLETELGKFAGKDASVRTIECRTTMCRVEVGVTNNDAGAAFAETWLHERTFDGPAYITQSDGTMVMFLGRSGTDLLSLK